MDIWPPHIYRREGEIEGINPTVLDRAIAQAHAVQRHGLPAVLTLNHLAILADVPYEQLRWIVERQGRHYRIFTIRKRRGGKREIMVPRPYLIVVQKWISRYVLSRALPHPASFAFFPRRGIYDCAAVHCGCKWLVKMDVESFFDSITERQVYLVFRELGYAPLISFEMARLCTVTRKRDDARQRWFNRSHALKGTIAAYQHAAIGYLPQGAPTSPMLSGLTTRRLDQRLTELASTFRVAYTRYADDIAFSSGDVAFGRAQCTELIRQSHTILCSEGLRPNLVKSVVCPPSSRRLVLGLLVDGDVPRLTRQFRARLDQHLYNLKTHKPAPTRRIAGSHRFTPCKDTSRGYWHTRSKLTWLIGKKLRRYSRNRFDSLGPLKDVTGREQHTNAIPDGLPLFLKINLNPVQVSPPSCDQSC